MIKVTDEDVERATEILIARGWEIVDEEIFESDVRAALESFATSLPAARVPDGFIELLARAEDVANVDWTHMESGSWQKMRGLRTAIGMAKMSMFDAAPQAGKME